MYRAFRNIITSLTGLTLLFFAGSTFAENSEHFGDYVIHYNAFRSDTLSPEIAKNYNLTRRNNRIIINISVLKKVMNTTGKPVSAEISGHASNLTGQLKSLSFREIREGNAIYYLAETKINDGEFLKFEIDVTPEDEPQAANIRFDKRFFTH